MAPLKFYGQEYIADNDELDRFSAGAGFPGKSSADWCWVQHMHANLNAEGRAAVVLDTGAASRGSGNADHVFENGAPKNFIPDAGIQRISDILIEWKEEDKLSRIVDHAELKRNDYNIHTSNAETHRPIAEIVEELNVVEAEAQKTDKAIRKILKKLGVGG